MTLENFETIIGTLVTRTPFRPFTVELVGGSRFEVDGPRARVARDGVAVFVAPGGVPIWFEHESVTQIIGETAEASP
jgi:hypothetical protein